jgi:hypothetical protein
MFLGLVAVEHSGQCFTLAKEASGFALWPAGE